MLSSQAYTERTAGRSMVLGLPEEVRLRITRVAEKVSSHVNVHAFTSKVRFPVTSASPSSPMAFLAPSLPFTLWHDTFQYYESFATTTTTAEHDFTSDMSNDYLTASLDTPASRLNELKNWLRGFITARDFFTMEPLHTLDDLHSALLAAVKEIRMKLDPELQATIHAAGESQHGIECNEDSFWTSRVLDVNKLYTTGLFGIKTLHRERATALLAIARDEVQWLTNEVRRLETHCKIAQDLKGCKNRESFSYYPSPRNERPEELRSLKGVGIVARVDGEGVDIDELLEDGEIEDEAMLEAGEDRRDSKDVIRGAKKENLNYMEL
ncbi:hypothetical protein DOTSEDRAFT_69736 [Dothistroma septosporum NZE10]|uniref:Uncharacterized protein n=1 Tax=Dothistroma septosporum (strain NZE10 / CBS 128990) TaxID=675120 RepID=N1PZT2_DOTSN|nr:hypothetical protein DOTSEDRAFT_69736 [Dothistroma septosporum NZE10]